MCYENAEQKRRLQGCLGDGSDRAGAVDGGGIGTTRTYIAAIRDDGSGAAIGAASALGRRRSPRDTFFSITFRRNTSCRNTFHRPDRDSARGGIAQHSRCAKRPAYRCGANLCYEDAVPTG